MENKVYISKIFFEPENDNVKVCSKIKSDKPEYKLWFEIDNKYEKYVCYEKMDAFLITVLPYAIKKELDIVVEGNVSERLYYQLSTYLIPMLCNKFNKRIIKIDAKLDNALYNLNDAVGTGISCGVDSLYTIKKHSNRLEKKYNITHLTFFNAGASGEFGGEKARELYKNRMRFAKKFSKENNFEFISIDSNMNEFLMMNHEKTHTFRSLACALLLQKLFSKYYYSSGLEFDDTRIDEFDTACYDILNVQCLSTEDITFYSTGMETTRIGKVKYISDYEPSYKYLNVCIYEEHNCGTCEKCRRTLIELDALGLLELYSEIFDIEKYNKDRNKNLIFMLKMKRQKNVFYMESYNEFEKNKIKIPLIVRLISYIPNMNDIKFIVFKIIPKEKLKKILKKDQKNLDDSWSIKK